MGRLIEAEALLRDMVTCCASTQFGRATAKMCIKRAPTVDAVEVVRCGECRFNSTCERIVKIVPKNSKGGSMSAHLHGCEYGMRKDGES